LKKLWRCDIILWHRVHCKSRDKESDDSRFERGTYSQYSNLRILFYKAVPLQAWSGPVDSRKLRFPDYMTTAQDGGKVVSLTHRPPLPPGNALGTHFW